ncbi:putative palmitoyltransferase zdhhc11 [Nannochloropsis gaditana]|uniref:Palmitoyltransferase n=3 Tax=Nannochloropsis gaditana TaxID=72520 RepID=W7TLB3_9STRA|nr:putative palmitoyltransferase zdhhc11 [Nannochloropsis gaditana]
MARRRHGLEHPLGTLQMLAWGAFLFTAASFLLIMPSRFNPYSFALPSILGFCLLLTLIAGIYTTLIDPCDEALLRMAPCDKESHDVLDRSVDQQQQEQQQERVYCYICQASVGRGTAHCRQCNKCIAGFDQHCAWLNTCIGQRNYLPFICTLWCAFSVTILQASMSFVILVQWMAYGSNARIFSSITLPVKVYIFLTVIVGTSSSIISFLLGQMLLFHLFLSIHEMTSYQYVILQSQRERSHEEREAANRELVKMMKTKHSTDAVVSASSSLPPSESSSPTEPPCTASSLSSRWRFPKEIVLSRLPPALPSPRGLSFLSKRDVAPSSLPGDVFLAADEEDDEGMRDDDAVVIHF